MLFISYFFPPTGGAGVQRTLKFVRYLPLHGYEPVVVTGPGESGRRWDPLDEALGRELPPDLQVVRVPGPVPGESGGLRPRVERWLDRPSAFSRWWVEGATRSALEIGRDLDLVVASMSPFESAEVAALVGDSLGLPWVADLRDPWALDEMVVYPTSIHRRLARRRMGRALGSASAVVMNTPEATRRLQESFPLRGKPVVTITNGFDAGDFSRNEPARSDDAFRIVHAGYLHTELGEEHRRRRRLRRLLGGTLFDVDILTRSHVYLLEALTRLQATAEPDAPPIELHLAGLLSAGDLDHVRQQFVKIHGYLSHPETVALLRSADLLFLPMHDLPPGVRAGIVPGKTYEYLAAGAPILAAVPDGDARDFLAEAGNAYICRPRDVGAMVGAISTELARRRAGTPPCRANPELVQRFERRRLTAQLAELFDVVLARPRLKPSGAAKSAAP